MKRVNFNVVITIGDAGALSAIFGARRVDCVLLTAQEAGALEVFIAAENAEYAAGFDEGIEIVIGDIDAAVSGFAARSNDVLLVVDGAAVGLTDFMLLESAIAAKDIGVKILNPCKLPGYSHAVFQDDIMPHIHLNSIHKHQSHGVKIYDADGTSTIISPLAKIGRGTVIYPGTIIEGMCEIGENCIVGPNAHLIDVKLGDNVHFWHSVAQKSRVGSFSSVGPFAYLRPDSVIGEHCKIGDFVEVKNATIGDGSKASHLSYIGDAYVGKNVNIGCGVITVNYDGKNKHLTTINDRAFVGCNSNLIAPVTVEQDSYIAAGSTISDDVPAGALAIARARQTIKEGWVANRRGNH